MKALLSILVISFLIFQSSIIAQNYSPIRMGIDSIFSELDLQYITTGILIDKTAQFYDLNLYDGINDSLTNFTKLKAFYRTIELSSFNRSGFVSYDSIKCIVDKNLNQSLIPIFILNYNYESLKQYAVDSNLSFPPCSPTVPAGSSKHSLVY